MASLRLDLEDEVVHRLEERAREAGVEPGELARRVVAAFLDDDLVGDLPFFASGSSSRLQGERVDGLLAERFGQ